MKKIFLLFLLAGCAHAQLLSANGSITGPTSILTGETTIFKANCTMTGSPADVDVRIQDDSQGSFSNSTTAQSSVYVNVTNYTISGLSGTSADFTFLINTTRAGTYNLRSQCESTSISTPETANSTDAPSTLTVSQAFGYLNATMYAPPPGATTNVIQNYTFDIISNVTCISNNPTAICDTVNATAIYNSTSGDVQINATTGDVPLWSQGNVSCGRMNASNICRANWTVNAQGAIGTSWLVGMIAQSNSTSVAKNTTENGTISITGCSIDFDLQWNSITFGTLTPSSANVAPGNSGNLYNISVNPGSCKLDFYVKGTDLTNSSISYKIEVGNITWNNVSNSYGSSLALRSSEVAVRKNVPLLTEITLWFWLNVPPVIASFYNGTISITGVRAGEIF